MEPLRHANTMPPQGLSHQRSVARKPVGKQSVVSSPSPQVISLAHRPAPQQQQQQYPSGGYPHHQQQQNQQPNAQQQRPQSYHPGQQFHPGYPQQRPHQIHNAQPNVQSVQSIQQQQVPAQHLPQQQQHQGQYSQQPRPQLTQHQQPHHQSPQQSQVQQHSPALQQQVQTQPQQLQQHAPPQHQVQPQHPQQQPHQQQSPIQQQQQPSIHQPSPQQQIPGQYPQQQPFSPISSAANIASQTAQPTLVNTHQTPPQPLAQSQPQPQPQPQTPVASPAPLHHNGSSHDDINSWIPASVGSSSPSVATPATTIASVASPGPTPLHHNDPGHPNTSSFVPEHWIPASTSSGSPNIAAPAATIASVALPSPISTPTWDPTSPPPIQQTPTADVRRTSTGQPRLCNHCRKGIPLNVSVYTCLICSTAHIATNFCVWCFTSNVVNTSHSHDKSYYATESDPRVQPSVQDATTHMWTIRKNVSGRLWYTHNATGLKTHLKPTAAALSGFSGLPPGWDERRTPDGRTFYFNKRLGTSAWTKPPNSLPEGWKELRTPDATPFYVNEQLGLSTWDRPGQQPKQGNKVVVRRRPAPGQPITSQNVGDNILSATINAARLTGQGVESASRQVGKLGKKKNWRKLGRMLNQVNGLTGDNSGSDNEYNDYNDDSGFGFGDDSGGYQDQQQGQFQQSFDQSFSEQSQQSFDFGENQQQAMFQQPAYEQQATFEFSVQSGPTNYDQSIFDQQLEPFSVTTEVSYTTTEPQSTFEQSYEPQQDQYFQQTYEQQSSFETQQETTFDTMPNQESTVMDPSQQAQPLESMPPTQQTDYPPPSVPQEPYVQPMQPAPQPIYQPDLQQTYSTQQYIYDPTQVPQMTQQQVTVSYQVPTYTPQPAESFILQSQAQQPVYPVYIPNNQPEIITSDDHLVEVPGTTDSTTLVLNSGYGGNDILAGTSLAAEQSAVTTLPQEDVVSITVQSQSPAIGTTYTPEPGVVQESSAAGKAETIVSVDAVVAENDFNTAERCNQLI